MDLHFQPVEGQHLLKKYINLPFQLHAGYPAYVPPLIKDEFDFHNPDKNKQLLASETIKFLAFRGTETVGRIMGIIFQPWNEQNQVKTARFYQLDCINDVTVAHSLLQKIETWAIERNMTEIIGSFGFSDKDPQGIQIEGFEFPPVIASVSHQPYLAGLVETAGYVKFKDCVSYRMEIPSEMPDVYNRVYKRILSNHNLQLLQFSSRKELKPYFVPVMQLMNDAYRNIFGFVPMDESDINHLANQYLSVLDPSLVKLVINAQKKPVAFVIAMANISNGLRLAKGRILPIGFIPILWDMHHSSQLDLLLGAVADNYRGRGLSVLMGISLMETARKKGLKLMDSHLVLEENRLMRAELEKLGGILSKRYRIYRKMLNINE